LSFEVERTTQFGSGNFAVKVETLVVLVVKLEGIAPRVLAVN
jgi:hypothetical protein